MNKRVVYLSKATSPLGADDLVDLVNVASEKNAKCGITGLLLYSAGNFIQALEGPEASVERILSRILKDDRHRDLRMLIDETDHERIFSGWLMGLLDLDRQRDVDLGRLTELLRSIEEEGETRTVGFAAKELLRDFAAQLPVIEDPSNSKCA